MFTNFVYAVQSSKVILQKHQGEMLIGGLLNPTTPLCIIILESVL